MIRIIRGTTPASLNKPAKNFVGDDYKNKDVVDELIKMQHEKCCYCERSMTYLESAQEGEHFVPSSFYKNANGKVDWGKANQWSNILYSCRTCNLRKRSKYPFDLVSGKYIFIDPSYKNIDPEVHIGFKIDYPLIAYVQVKNSRLGKNTIEILKISERPQIQRKLRNLILEIDTAFNRLLNSIERNSKINITTLLGEIRRTMSANLPHASFTRRYVEQKLDKLNNEDLPALAKHNNESYSNINIQIPSGAEIVI